MLLVPRVAFATACSAAALNQGQLLMSWLCSRRTMLTSSLPTYRGFVSHRYGAFPTMPCERDACGRLGERRRLACGRASPLSGGAPSRGGGGEGTRPPACKA